MTILEVKNQLVSHFSQKTYFGEEDISNIKLPEELSQFKDSLVYEALGDLEKIEMVKKVVSAEEEECWVLVRPFGSYVQNVEISPHAAEAISNTINHFAEANDLEWPVADKTFLLENDIMMLVDIIHEILETNHGGQNTQGHGTN